jgi:GDP-L-fucose synthase
VKQKSKKIFVAGHRGMVGSAIFSLLKKKNHEVISRTRTQLDLLNQKAVINFLKNNYIDQIYIAAAKVGGIYANDKYPAQFIYENLMIEANLIHSAFLSGIKKILFIGSSCIYPKFSKQPIKEKYLLSGYLEASNEPYAIAKIAGIKMCESYNRQYGKSHKLDFRSIMPCNIYGAGDNYHGLNSHVIPALLKKFHYAKINKKSTVTVWGSGNAKREFLNVRDLAKAAYFIMNLNKKVYIKNTSPMCSHINVGSGKDLTIKDLVKKIKKIIGYSGKIIFDDKKPDGTKRKLLDIAILKNLGWRPKINLDDGLKKTYSDFTKNEYNI